MNWLLPLTWLVGTTASAQQPEASDVADSPTVLCCDSNELTAQVKLYLRVQRALHTGDGLGELQGPMYAWAPRVKRLKTTASAAESDAIAQLETLTQRLKSGRKSTFAESFPDLSRLVTFLVLRHPGGSLALREARCEDKPWLQKEGPLASPYPDAADCGFRPTP